MILRITKTPRALEDLAENFAFIARDNPDAAERFMTAAQQTFIQIADMPKIGVAFAALTPVAFGLRSFRISGFPYLVFYRINPEAINIVRVLHVARDIPAALDP